MNKKKVMFLGWLDVSKSFDAVDHTRLCKKLKVFFIGSYVTDRSQAGQINNALSGFLPIASGRPQVSSLS